MLKGIPLILSPELLKVLAEMGHGDTITIGDAYFAAASMAKENILVRCDGVSAPELADAILTLMPLDTWADSCVTVMGAEGKPLGVCNEILEVVERHCPEAAASREIVDRFAFYDRAKRSYAVVAAGQQEKFGCVIFQKGVL